MIKLIFGTSALLLYFSTKMSKELIWWSTTSWLFIMILVGIKEFPMHSNMNIFCGVGMDVLSFSMILLSFWISALMLVASTGVIFSNNYPKEFINLSILLMWWLLMAFSSCSMLMFYFSFEASLIPTLMMILGWGYQPERIQAGNYLMFYTLTASLPLLVGVMFIYQESFSMEMWMSWKFMSSFSWSLYLVLILAFLVKMPMFLVHLWLPKAHVEAPVAGSMMLAGVLLKLGGYGLIRFMKNIIEVSSKLNYWWISLSLVGGVWISLVCLRQTDLKSLVAYSSVAHMSLVLCGIMTMSVWGIMGSLVLMIGHGLCSSCLFSMVNIIYERSGSRSLVINRGYLNLMPSMAMWWFMLSACNMAAPPSLNLLGEIELIISIISWSWLGALGLMLISFLSAAYSLHMYAFSQHGSPYSGQYSCMSGSNREFFLVAMHWIPLNFLILKSEWLFIEV